MHRRQSRQAGFTLAEAAIGLFLLSVALLTLMAEFTVSGRSIILGRERTSATYLAQVMLERLTNEALVELAQYDAVDTRNTSTYPAGAAAKTAVENWANQLGLQLRPGAYGTISVQSPVNVEPDPSKTPVLVDGLTRIGVEVYWLNSGGRTSNVKLFLVRRS